MSGGNHNGQYDHNLFENSASSFNPFSNMGNLPIIPPPPQTQQQPAQQPLPVPQPVQHNLPPIQQQPMNQQLSFMAPPPQTSTMPQSMGLPNHASPLAQPHTVPGLGPNGMMMPPQTTGALSALPQLPQSTDFAPQNAPMGQQQPSQQMLPQNNFNPTNPAQNQYPQPAQTQFSPANQQQNQFNPTVQQQQQQHHQPQQPQQHQLSITNTLAPLPQMPQQQPTARPIQPIQPIQHHQQHHMQPQQPHMQQQTHNIPQQTQIRLAAPAHAPSSSPLGDPVFRYKHPVAPGGEGNICAAQPFISSQQLSMTYRQAVERNRKLSDKTKRRDQKQYRYTPVNHQSPAYLATLRNATPSRTPVPTAIAPASDPNRRSIRTHTTDDSGRFSTNPEMKICYNTLQKLMELDEKQIFSQPVNPELHGCPDYFKIIKSPMDLGTIRTNLLNGTIQTAQQFKDNVGLVFQNAMIFNPEHHEIHQLAKQLRNRFEVIFDQSTKAPQLHQHRTGYAQPPATSAAGRAAGGAAGGAGAGAKKPRPSTTTAAAGGVGAGAGVGGIQPASGPQKRPLKPVDDGDDDHPNVAEMVRSNQQQQATQQQQLDMNAMAMDPAAMAQMMNNPLMAAMIQQFMMQQFLQPANGMAAGLPNPAMGMMMPNMAMGMPNMGMGAMPMMPGMFPAGPVPTPAPVVTPAPAKPRSRTGPKKQRVDDPLAQNANLGLDSTNGQPLLPPPVPIQMPPVAPQSQQSQQPQPQQQQQQQQQDTVISEEQIDQLQELAGTLSEEGVEGLLQLLSEFIPDLDMDNVDVSSLTQSQFNRAIQFAERAMRQSEQAGATDTSYTPGNGGGYSSPFGEQGQEEQHDYQ